MDLKGIDADEAAEIMKAHARNRTSTSRFYAELQQMAGGRTIVDKLTTYAIHLETLQHAETIFENAFYIHLTRNPGTMTRSFESVNIDEIFLRQEQPYQGRQLAELIWTTCNENICQFLDTVPKERSLHLRYEDLVASPEEKMREFCAASGLEFHPDMIDPYKEKEKKMTDGIHSVSLMLGDMKFHRHSGIDPKLAKSDQNQEYEAALAPTARELAGQLGYSLLADAQSEQVSRLQRQVSELENELSRMRELVANVERDGGVDVRTTSIFQRPLVVIQETGSKPPFVFTGLGAGQLTRNLSKALGPERPFYALLAESLDGNKVDSSSVAETAARYVRELREVQPTGPYSIGGFCAQGVVALETAQQLAAAGEEVAFLGMFESPAPIRLGAKRKLANVMQRDAGRARSHFKKLKSLSLLGKMKHVMGMVRNAGGRMVTRIKRTSQKYMYKAYVLFGRQAPESLRNARAVRAELRTKYKASEYPGTIHVFRAQNSMFTFGPDLGWGDLARDGVEIHTIGGSHSDMLDGKNVAELADTLDACLSEIESPGSETTEVMHAGSE